MSDKNREKDLRRYSLDWKCTRKNHSKNKKPRQPLTGLFVAAGCGGAKFR